MTQEQVADLKAFFHAEMDKYFGRMDKRFGGTEATMDAKMEVPLKESMASLIERGFTRVIRWVVGLSIFSIVFYSAVVIGITYKVNPNILLNPVSLPWIL